MPVRKVLSPSFRAHIGYCGRAAATKCVSPRHEGTFSDLERGKNGKNALAINITPPKRTGGVAVLELRPRESPAKRLREMYVRGVLPPSLIAHIGLFGRVATTK
jgi:hypothetical protein